MTGPKPDVSQILTAQIGCERIRTKYFKDTTAAEKLLRDHLAKLKKAKSPGYESWKYNIEDRSGRDSVFESIRSALSYSSDIVKYGPWDQFLTPNEKKLVKHAGTTHCPTNDREAWAFEIGSDSFGSDVNSDDIPDGPKLTPSIASGLLTVTLDGDLLEVTPREKHVAVTCEISSWRGVSIGAEHYYAKLKCWYFQPNLKVISVGKKKGVGTELQAGQLYGMSGHGDCCKPRITKLSNITIRRPLTALDIKETCKRGNKDRYEGYDKGDYIDGFWSEQSAIACAKKEFERIFDSSTVAFKIDN